MDLRCSVSPAHERGRAELAVVSCWQMPGAVRILTHPTASPHVLRMLIRLKAQPGVVVTATGGDTLGEVASICLQQ
jgi:hypothetical protein